MKPLIANRTKTDTILAGVSIVANNHGQYWNADSGRWSKDRTEATPYRQHEKSTMKLHKGQRWLLDGHREFTLDGRLYVSKTADNDDQVLDDTEDAKERSDGWVIFHGQQTEKFWDHELSVWVDSMDKATVYGDKAKEKVALPKHGCWLACTYKGGEPDVTDDDADQFAAQVAKIRAVLKMINEVVSALDDLNEGRTKLGLALDDANTILEVLDDELATADGSVVKMDDVKDELETCLKVMGEVFVKVTEVV